MSRPAAVAEEPRAAGRARPALRELPWREPLDVLAPFADEPWAIGLIGGGDGWSYVARGPAAHLRIEAGDPRDPLAELDALLGTRSQAHEGPPFCGGVAGVLGYGLGARLEPPAGQAADSWPEAAFGLYLALLAFDHGARRVFAVGRGADADEATARADEAAGWLREARPSAAGEAPGCGFEAVESAAAYADAVAGIVERISAGELFQANIARTWRGRFRPGARPFDLFARLAAISPAPFAGYFRLEDAAVVSNSPERFLRVDARSREAITQPIKGTRPRGADPAADGALREELAGSAKDRAENLMIVDLMRNDLARACAAGSVRATAMFEVESYANVHHLVSTVKGLLRPEAGAGELLRATFPPGSVTGAPKVQAMRVIAEHETPRGPYCGAMFWAGLDGGFDSSVLIRTAACTLTAEGWALEARAGAGVTAGSDPAAEAEETEAKIDAIRRAFVGSP